jgi:hypothetical protein
MNTDNNNLCNFDEQIEKITNEKNKTIEKAKQIENNAYLKYIIDKNNIALQLYHNNMYHYCNYNNYGSYDIKISDYYDKYHYDEEIKEFIKNKILANNRKKFLLQEQNIIENLDNKFIVIYVSCYFPLLDEFDINMDFIIQYKHDIIRLCFENPNIYMACFSNNGENNKIELEMEFGRPYFELELNMKYLKNDCKYITEDNNTYYMFSMKDFYDAIKVY